MYSGHTSARSWTRAATAAHRPLLAYRNMAAPPTLSERERRSQSLHAKYSVGDYARISRTKNTFECGYEKNFNEEIFKIKRIKSLHRLNLYTYILQDLNGEEIDVFLHRRTSPGRRQSFRDQ